MRSGDGAPEGEGLGWAASEPARVVVLRGWSRVEKRRSGGG